MRDIILTNPELIIADFILLNSVAGERVSVANKMTGMLDIDVYMKYPHEASEIISLIKKREKSIRKFLLQEHYILCIGHSPNCDMLTDKGLHAKKLGGHKNYAEWDKSQKSENGIKTIGYSSSYFSKPLKYINPLNLVNLLRKINSKDKNQS